MMKVTTELFSSHPPHWACACSLRQGKLRQKLHVVYASSCSRLSTQCEYLWVVRLELGTHRWVSFHLPRSPASHPCWAPSPARGCGSKPQRNRGNKTSHGLHQKSLRNEKAQRRKQHKQVHNCLFQQLRIARRESVFSSRSWQLCGHYPNLAVNFHVCMIHYLPPSRTATVEGIHFKLSWSTYPIILQEVN